MRRVTASAAERIPESGVPFVGRVLDDDGFVHRFAEVPHQSVGARVKNLNGRPRYPDFVRVLAGRKNLSLGEVLRRTAVSDAAGEANRLQQRQGVRLNAQRTPS
jgi:hypothetical protein